MKIIGVDPSYNGLGITVIDPESKTIDLRMIRRKNLGKKYWEFFAHAESIRDEYRDFFREQGEYIVFFELPVMNSKFGVGLYTLDTLLLDFHNTDEACIHVGLYNSNYLANFLRGRRSLKKSELKKLGMDILERYRGKGYSITEIKWNPDLSASLIFASSGLITLYKHVIERHIRLQFKLEGEQGISSVGVRWRARRNSLTTDGTKAVGKESGEWDSIPVTSLILNRSYPSQLEDMFTTQTHDVVSRNPMEGTYPSQKEQQEHILLLLQQHSHSRYLFLLFPQLKKKKVAGGNIFSLSLNIFNRIVRENLYYSEAHSGNKNPSEKIQGIKSGRSQSRDQNALKDVLYSSKELEGKIDKYSLTELYVMLVNQFCGGGNTPGGGNVKHNCSPRLCYLIPVDIETSGTPELEGIGTCCVIGDENIYEVEESSVFTDMLDISGDLLNYGDSDIDLRWKSPVGSLFDQGALGRLLEIEIGTSSLLMLFDQYFVRCDTLLKKEIYHLTNILLNILRHVDILVQRARGGAIMPRSAVCIGSILFCLMSRYCCGTVWKW